MSERGAGNTQRTKAQWFTTTHWSIVLMAKNGALPEATNALEKLCSIYWPSVYAYIRRDGYPPPEAQDLTQEFFARLLSNDYLHHLQDRRGKFRSFLLTFVKHFLNDERKKEGALKRGGGQVVVSLDAMDSEERYLTEPADKLDPYQAFERRWAQTLLHNTVDRLKNEYIATGKKALFEALKDLEIHERGEQTYAEVGTQLGLTVSAVKAASFRLRRRHRELLREEIAQTVGSSEEIEDEIKHLLSALS
ncbi:MAG: hypothetical protein JWM16_3525 [Verrucomicrobiales bacterium]|nr:hypothetical protein [Verrucomicrobiales bacterium]